MERLLILDSNSLLNRAFYAIPPLTNNEGIHTNAVYGFTNMLFKMKEEIKPDYIVAAFDRKAPTFRHKEYEDYIENALDEADREAENPNTKYYSHDEFKQMARRILDGEE